MPDSSPAATGAVAVAAAALLALSAAAMVLAAAGANAPPTSAVCGGGGTGQTIADVTLDAEQIGNARTIVSVVARRRLPVYAAQVAVDTAYTESVLHNSTAQTDHDSEGLFQQRVSLYTAAVAADPIRATSAFLDRLGGVPGWQTNPVGVDAQTVQISAYPERYEPNAALAAQLVGQFWPAAAAAVAGSAPTAQSGSSATAPAATAAVGGAVAVCAGAGGAVATGDAVAGTIVGPTGNNVAGTTAVPAGFTLAGSTQGETAVRFALAQLGKPYVWAAAGPAAFDCSGLTMAAWATAGVALPHLAAGQALAGTAEPADLSQAVSGDLVLIPGSDGTPAAPGHVGMVAGYVDARGGRHLYLIHAPMTGLAVELTEATEWSWQIVDVRHIA